MPQSVTVDTKVFLPPGNLMAWTVCLSAGLFFFYEFFQLNIFDVINQPLRNDFHIDATQLSWMSSAYLWADILFLLPAGMILDSFSTRTVILSALFICVIGTLGFALTHSFIIASFCHFLSGIGNAFCFLSCVVLVSNWFPPRRQALLIGLLVTMAFAGGMMAHTPFAYLYESFGWRNALLIDGLVGILLFVWIFVVVQDKPYYPQPQKNSALNNKEGLSIEKEQGKIKRNLWKALANRHNWLAGFYTSFLNLPIMVLCALWGASYLQVVHHLSEINSSNIISLIFMGSIIGCPLAGWLSDSQGRRKPLMIFGAVATLLTVIPLLFYSSLPPLTLSILFFALGFFTSTQIISYPLIAESNSIETTGTATAIASVIIMGGAGVGQVIFGWLMTLHASPSVTSYSITDFQFAMWIFPTTTIAALVTVLITRETFCKRESLRSTHANGG